MKKKLAQKLAIPKLLCALSAEKKLYLERCDSNKSVSSNSVFYKRKLPSFLLISAIFFSVLSLAGCVQPVGPAWTGVSTGTMPPVSALPGGAPYGERTPIDRFAPGYDPSGSFSSSLPPGYPAAIDEASYQDASQNQATPTGTSSPSTPTPAGANSPTGFGSMSPGGDMTASAEEFLDPVEDWLVQDGITLRQLLTDWSDRAGWRIVWKSKMDFTIEAGAMLRGRYIDVCSAVLRNLARAKPAPIATFYKGNRVLLIETLEDENAY